MKTVILALLLSSPAAAFQGSAPGSAPRSLKGVVQESLPAGSYTYLLIKTKGGEEWAAVEKAELKKGASVEVMESTVMEDFESPLLKRKFKKVVFGVLAGAAPKTQAAAPMPAGHGASAAPAPLPAAKTARPKGDPVVVTVAEAHARAKELSGKLVAVTGKVVKANANILGRNWFHLQDGTGNAKAGTDDLTLTTTGTAEKGSRVKAVGVLAAGKDLGSGYSYDAILEDADLSPAQ